MKKWITIAGILILTLPVMAQAAGYPSTNITITVLTNQLVDFSYAYESTNNTMDELFAELPGNNLPTRAPKVLLWDTNAQQYIDFTKSASGKWSPTANLFQNSGTNRLTRGLGVFIKGAPIGGPVTLHFSGSFPTNETTAINAKGLIGFPYPVDVAFTNTEIARTAVNGDRLGVWNTTNQVWDSYSYRVILMGGEGSWEPSVANLVLKNCSAFQYSSTNTNSVVYERNPYAPPYVLWWMWMNQYGLTNYAADAVSDVDLDGLTSGQEYIAGTDPTNSASGFCVTEDPRNVLGWNAVSGRVYSVYWATNLLDGFQCLESNIPWTQVSFTNSTDVPCGYYKIGVRLEN